MLGSYSEVSEAPRRVDLRVATRGTASAATQAPPLGAYVEIVPGLDSMHVETRHRGNAIWSSSFRYAANMAERLLAQILTVLTACRTWRFAEEGCHCSKAAAGEWGTQA